MVRFIFITLSLLIFVGKINAQNRIDNNSVVIVGNYTLTPLGVACYKNQLDTIKQLLIKDSRQYAMENSVYEYDITYASVYFEKEDILHYLIDKGYDLNNIYDDNGLTLLFLACKLSKANIVKILLDAGANVNGSEYNDGDYTLYPILEAIEQNNIEIVKLLIRHNVNINIKNKEGVTPLKLAEQERKTHIIEIIRQYINHSH